MDWLDFMTHFHQVQVAHYDLNAAAGLDETRKLSWNRQLVLGDWTVKTAGGCPNFHSNKFNKQYQLTAGSEEIGNVHVLIAFRSGGCYKDGKRHGEACSRIHRLQK